MELQIEGCTQEELEVECGYLTVGRAYKVDRQDGYLCYLLGDGGLEVVAAYGQPGTPCLHLPDGAKWVEVQS